jgi:hypothetical protein
MVAFILKAGQQALPLSARDQTQAERKYYEKVKKCASSLQEFARCG